MEIVFHLFKYYSTFENNYFTHGKNNSPKVKI